jgi:LPXTG-motif cell wall-anchored protein
LPSAGATHERPGSGYVDHMNTGRDAPPRDTDNPAVAADAEQHVRQEIASLGNRAASAAASAAGPLAVLAGAAVAAACGWLVGRRRRKR